MIYPIKSGLLNPSATATMRQTGFTLVEMTVVLLLITLIASVAVRETAELGFQTRYEQTKERLEMIRQAILGNPKLVINGQQAVSGFVADMGRLPDNLRELLQMGFCVTAGATNPPLPVQIVTTARNPNACTGTNEWRWTSAPCTDGVSTLAACTGGHIWLARQPDPTLNSGLSFGWNGAYLTISGSPTDNDALTDGWGTTTDNLFYGWRYEQGLNLAMLGDLNPANDQTDPNGVVRLVVQSFGKDQTANGFPTNDFIDDFPSNIRQNDAGVHYPNPLVDKEDWLVNISQGVSVNLPKVRNMNGGTCNFLGGLANVFSAERANCLNAGGSAAPSCSYTAASCATATGAWNAVTHFCDFTSATCSGAGGTWNATTNSCYISQSSCTAPSTWSGRIPCSFEPASCATAGGTWNAATYSCDFISATCSGAGKTWDTTTSSCDFTPAVCAASSGTWGCSINRQSCNADGGLWRECKLAPAQCITAGGTNSFLSCDFSRLSCLNVNGSWSDSARSCSFTSTTCPAGSTWNGSGCAFSGNQCELAGGHNRDFCSFSTSAACSTAGGSYDSNTGLCSFTPAACATLNGISQTPDCAMSNREGENFGPKFFPTNCETQNGIWQFPPRLICANVFYRANGKLNYASSSPVVIEEDGSYQTRQFTNFTDSSDFDGNGITVMQNITYVSTGQNAIGIYEYDGDCDPANNPPYPADRQNTTQVDFQPHTTLPVINW